MIVVKEAFTHTYGHGGWVRVPAGARTEIVGLRAFRERAIVKYPDLDIDPAVLAAREKLKAFEPTFAADIDRGLWDDSTAMRVLLSVAG